MGNRTLAVRIIALIMCALLLVGVVAVAFSSFR